MDVDVIVKGEEFQGIGQRLQNTGILEAKGYVFFYDKKYPDIGRMCITESAKKFRKWERLQPEKAEYFNAYPYSDIYQTDTKYKDSVVVKFGPLCRFPLNVVYPLHRMTAMGRSFSVPRNTTAYLTQLYGDWKTIPPKEKQTGHGAYSDSCKGG